ncbi:MAG: UDP-3-O-(3-hydroxymyristoyl)glucosamine N-acyltransferase [Nitrospirae bacterium]|nr:UDP-3-O-(3-hydroxymyristoyl)glucosamine N-acyltransferase [Nitrospirota bacterium]
MKLKDLKDIIGGSIRGDSEVEIRGVSNIKEANEGDITFIADKKYLNDVYGTKASAVISGEEIKEISASQLIVDDPYFAFAKALEVFYKKPYASLGVSDKAFIGADVAFGKDVSIHPLSYIGSRVIIGDRVTISPGVYIGDDVSIGNDAVIYPNVTIRENVKIGKGAIIHPGTVIGSDGFGYIQKEGKSYKIPQVGSVIIEDDVEIGSSVTIDRATVGNTIIGEGTKIDNLVQIAHNVKIGRNCLIVAQVGISGSAEIGDNVVLGGQTGVRDHVRIGSRAMIGARSGVVHDIPEARIFSGYPAMPHKEWLRAQSIYAKLPEILRRLQELERNKSKEGG